MTTIYFPDPRVRQRLYEGPLAICIDAFAERLTRQGYTSATAREKLRLIAHLSRWPSWSGEGRPDLIGPAWKA
jgi:hypothetical protein